MKPETAAAAPMDAETAALIAQGAALDAETAPPPVDANGQPVAERAPTDFNSEAAMLISTLVLIAGPFFPSVPKVWTKDKQAAVAAAAAPVMEKHGFTIKQRPELREAVDCGSPLGNSEAAGLASLPLLSGYPHQTHFRLPRTS